MELQGTTLTVTVEGEASHTLTIEDYKPGDLGIHLPGLSAPIIAEGTAAEELIKLGRSGDRMERTPRIPPHDAVITSYGASVDRVLGHGGGDLIQVYDHKPGLIIYGDGAEEDPHSDGDDSIVYTKVVADIPSESTGLIVFGGGGKDVLGAGTGGRDLFIGGSGHDVARGGEGGDQLYGGSENDLLSGQEGADIVQGDGGNDRLLGGAGADFLIGGAGEDWLYGDSGVRGFKWDGEKEMFLRPEWLPRYLDPSVADQLWWIHFDQHGPVNQSVHHWAVIDDVKTSEVGQDQLYGGDGEDRLFGGGGDDQLHGDRGVDTLQGEAGADRLWGGEGRDVLWGDKNPDTYDNDTKIIDSLTIEYTSELDQQVITTAKFNWRKHLEGAEVAGDDLLDGGSENDILHGGGGNDTYRFGYGYHVDVIDDASGTDVIRLGAGITAQDVRLSSAGDDLLIQLLQAGQGTGDQLIVSGWNAGRTVESIVFADGTLWDAQAIREKAGFSEAVAPAPPPSHYALGTSHAEYLPGTEGNDVLYGLGGADHIEGKAGADRLFGGEGSDRLLGGAGADGLYGEAGADLLQGGEGDDALSGGVGDDHLNGGAGTDRLDGGAGADLYELSLGMGNDTIAETQADGALNRIKLPSGSLLEDVELQRTGSDLLLRMNDNDKLTIKDYYLDPARWQIETASGEVQSLDEAPGDGGFDRSAWRRFQEGHYGELLRDAEEYNATYGLYRPLSGQVQITRLSGSLPIILDPGEEELQIITPDDPTPSAQPIILDLPMSGGHYIRFLDDVLNRRERRVELSTGHGSDANDMWLPERGSFASGYELDVYLRLTRGNISGSGSVYTASIAEQTLTAPGDTGAKLRARGDIYANVLRAEIDVVVGTERFQIFGSSEKSVGGLADQ